jgi:hypothetical protein
VHAHPDVDFGTLRPVVLIQRPLRVDGGLSGGPRACEDVEEGVPLVVDLLAAVARKRLLQETAMFAQQLAVPLA